MFKNYLFIFLVGYTAVLSAQSGYLDPTFGNGGIAILSQEGMRLSSVQVAIQPSGRLLLLYRRQPLPNGAYFSEMAGLTYDGFIDTTFGNQGIFQTNLSFTSSIASSNNFHLLNDGKILLRHPKDSAVLFRLSADGIPDDSFGVHGAKTLSVWLSDQYGILPNGHIRGLCVRISLSGVGMEYGVGDFLPDGNINPAFYGGDVNWIGEYDLDDYYYTGELLPNGKLYIGGHQQLSSNMVDIRLSRFDQAGYADYSFNNDGYVLTNTTSANFVSEYMQDLKVLADGKILACGSSADRLVTLRYLPTGVLDSTFGNFGMYIAPPVTNYLEGARKMTVAPDGTFYCIGSIFNLNATEGYIAKFQVNGLPDSTFGQNGIITLPINNLNVSAFFRDIELLPDGKILVLCSNDNNVNLLRIDPGAAVHPWYQDLDGDGYGNSAESVLSVNQPTGFSAASGDCNDNNASINPGAPEICSNDIDDDCDGNIDEDTTPPVMLCKPALTVELGASGISFLSLGDLNQGSYDACGAFSIINSTFLFECNAAGTTTNIPLTGTDVAGNMATCYTSVTVQDLLTPVAICMDTVVFSVTENEIVTLSESNIDANSYDNCEITNYALSVSEFTYNDIGLNTVVLTVTDAAGNTNSCETVVKIYDKNSATNTVADSDLYTVYPNPSTGIFKLKTPATMQFDAVTVYTQTGTPVYISNSAAAITQIDLSGKPGGVYYLNARFKNTTVVIKLVLF